MIDVIVTKFFPPCFKLAESFENLGNILREWAKDEEQKSLAEVLNRFEKQEVDKVKPFLLKNNPEKFSRSLSRQSSETKSNTKLVLASRKPLLYLELNRLNKQNVSEIN